MSDNLFGSVLATFPLLGFFSVLPVHFFIHTPLFFPVLALVTSGKMQLGYICLFCLLFPLCCEFLHVSCFLLPSGHPGLRETLCAGSHFLHSGFANAFSSFAAGEETSSHSFPFKEMRDGQ